MSLAGCPCLEETWRAGSSLGRGERMNQVREDAGVVSSRGPGACSPAPPVGSLGGGRPIPLLGQHPLQAWDLLGGTVMPAWLLRGGSRTSLWGGWEARDAANLWSPSCGSPLASL